MPSTKVPPKNVLPSKVVMRTGSRVASAADAAALPAADDTDGASLAGGKPPSPRKKSVKSTVIVGQKTKAKMAKKAKAVAKKAKEAAKKVKPAAVVAAAAAKQNKRKAGKVCPLISMYRIVI
jgi:hypothetical protein